MAETDRTSRSDEHPRGRLRFETLVSDTSSSLLAAHPEQLDAVVEGCLRRIQDFFRADRCVLLSVGEDRQVVRVRLASHSEGVSRMHGDLDPAQMFPWSWRLLDDERAPVRVVRLVDLPPEADADRQSLIQMATRSALFVPIETDGVLDHVFVLHTVHEERTWPDSSAQRLRVLGALLVGALKRQEMNLEIHQTAERLRLAVDSAEAGLWATDLVTPTLWATPRARVIFGFAADESVTTDTFWTHVHPDDLDLVREARAHALTTPGTFRVEFRVLRPGEDDVTWVSTLGGCQFAPDGRPVRLTGVTMDVSERKRAGEALRASEARLAAGAELAGLAFYEIDWRAGVVPYADKRTRDLLGLPPDEVLDLKATEFWIDHIHPDDRPGVIDMRSRLLSGKADRFAFEYRYMHPDRGETWLSQLSSSSARDADGRATHSYGVYRDITARKRVEAELRDLSHRLIGAHEEERALLARELHDDVSQRLAVLAIEAGRAESGLPEGPRAEAMRTLREGLVRLSEDVHSLAYQLHPSLLEELGLAEALLAECEHRERQGEYEITVDVDPISSDVDSDVALCLFRVAQEAMGNAARHAQASSVTVTLRQVDGGLLLAVADDGAGFDPEEPGTGRHLGLVSMRERTRLVSGTLDVESSPGRGTTVVAWVPLAEGPE